MEYNIMEKVNLTRPNTEKRTVEEGTYEGKITSAELREIDSKYEPSGKRIVLNIKVEIKDSEDDTVVLYIAPKFTWSSMGKMVKILENLRALPEKGETLNIDSLIGIPVKVNVENVEKDGEVYSNIVSIKKRELIKRESIKNGLIRKNIPKKMKTV